MIATGKLIEYLDNGKFMCALVTESQAKRLRLINQNGRELNLPVSRVVHCSNETHSHYEHDVERDIEHHGQQIGHHELADGSRRRSPTDVA